LGVQAKHSTNHLRQQILNIKILKLYTYEAVHQRTSKSTYSKSKIGNIFAFTFVYSRREDKDSAQNGSKHKEKELRFGLSGSGCATVQHFCQHRNGPSNFTEC
jgi:hypothetical protein